jgi:DNA replication protein DnaC
MTTPMTAKLDLGIKKLDRFFPCYLQPERLRRDRIPNLQAFDHCVSWMNSDGWEDDHHSWLYAFGRTGQAKTRCLAQILYSAVQKEPDITFEVWAASELKGRFAALCRDHDGLDDFKDDLTYCDILVIDDFGHTLSESFAENIRLVLERRGENTTIFTSQYSPRAFMNRWKADEQSQAIMRRILDFSEVVNFGGRLGVSKQAEEHEGKQ